METPKISFGFKLAAKPNLLPIKQKEAPKVKELIKCLEGQEIHLVDEKLEEAPLMIPMLGNQKTSTALASLMKRRAVLLGEEESNEQEEESTPSKVESKTITDENLEQRAARELLAQLQPNGENVEQVRLVLPALKADELPLDGAKQSTIDDYDTIPIQQFGLAMLRGMGWTEPPKKKGGPPLDEPPMLRPKGMGLGADKALKAKPLLVQPAANEVLEIKKLAYVRILGGKHKDAYGQIEGFDDHAGRVIVKMAIGGAKETFNEFLCTPVTKKEFTDYGKCINSIKYEEYKKLENEHGQIIKKPEKHDISRNGKSEPERRHYSEKNDRVKVKEESVRKYADDRKNYKDEQHDGKEIKNERRDYKDYKDGRRDYKDYKDERRDHKFHKDEVASSSRHIERVSKHKNEKETNQRQKDINASDLSRDVHKNINNSNRNYDERNRVNERRSRTPTRQNKQEHLGGNNRRRSTIEESDDASDSTQSDSDSAYERKHKKKSSAKSKKHKSKKSKSKSRRRANSSSSDEDDKSLTVSSDDERKHRKAKHKKKTKKSKHARSRTRSRSRARR